MTGEPATEHPGLRRGGAGRGARRGRPPTQPFGHGVPAQLGISGDALNVAAARGRGRRPGRVWSAVLTDDELGERRSRRGSPSSASPPTCSTFAAGQQGVYLVHSDPDGPARVLLRPLGAASGPALAPTTSTRQCSRPAGAVVASGITVRHLGVGPRRRAGRRPRVATRFVYDPNFRPRLTTAADAAAALAAAGAAAPGWSRRRSPARRRRCWASATAARGAAGHCAISARRTSP